MPLPHRRKLLVAAVGVAAMNYMACEGSSSGNLVAPENYDTGTADTGTTPDTAKDTATSDTGAPDTTATDAAGDTTDGG